MTAAGDRPGNPPRKAVVIGGGIGGLSCACMLAKEGVDTLLVEKNREAGGTARGFDYRGVHLELGCGISGPAGDGKSLSRFLSYFGVAGDVDVAMLPREACVKVCSGNETISLPWGIENYAGAVAERSPGDREEIMNFGKRIRFMMDNLPLYNIDRYFELADDVETRILLSRESVSECLQNIRSHMARRLLSLFWRFIGTPPLKAPMSLYGPEMGAFLEGPCTISGEKLCTSMMEKIKSFGGKIETLKKVTRIGIESRDIRGVEINGEDFYKADLVVSTLHPLDTMELIDDAMPVRRMKRRMEQAGETHGTFVSYFMPEDVDRIEAIEPGWHLVLGGKETAEHGGQIDPENIEEFDVGLLAARSRPAAGEVTRAIVLFPPGAFGKWRHTTTGKRGGEYEEMKERLAAKIKERLEAALPGAASGLGHLVSITPLTLRDKLGHKGGGFGILRSARLRGMGTCSWRTPVRGLFLGGHSVLYPGITGSMETSFLIGAGVFGEKHMVGRFADL